MVVVSQLLSVDEEVQILQKFLHECTRNRQVMWSGVPYDHAQRWAREHGMQTLSIAMGSLVDKNHPSCLKSKMSSSRWSKYMKGASAIFAYYISQGAIVMVLTPPPPHKFNPSGRTNYQAIEEPILKGAFGGRAVSRIEMVHPTVKGAENFSYQAWPMDETCIWIANFGALAVKEPRWRKAQSGISLRLTIRGNEVTTDQPTLQGKGVIDIGLDIRKVVWALLLLMRKR
ncbi:hypothetical protein LOZ52_005282 [Ophidiomyces ophidiicola]|nr:hypothetical protein LOZ49_006789 [Ophidiomyces ophidiicola]KAI2127182.1 hypothetical protein LOZ29_006778 [Ophidiomyces ophidiicola]KAI2128641.1 hypothetical protein LOZ28_006793 [Ophidiomyces ophidiicola]KAI2207629.1 hypothetical protein LOZ15_006755 [Ophidiomyces ophidiicola]KAI2423691.1 hypothetical protein LOZ52_005282 [Ophidiomyces ophidiicola]